MKNESIFLQDDAKKNKLRIIGTIKKSENTNINNFTKLTITFQQAGFGRLWLSQRPEEGAGRQAGLVECTNTPLLPNGGQPAEVAGLPDLCRVC